MPAVQVLEGVHLHVATLAHDRERLREGHRPGMVVTLVIPRLTATDRADTARKGASRSREAAYEGSRSKLTLNMR